MIVVTGGAGFIGSNLVASLLDKKHEVLIVDSFGSKEKWKNVRAKNYFSYCDKKNFLPELLGNKYKERIEAIVHLGASSSTTEINMDYLWENNIEYSQKLLLYCAEHDIRFIYASSAATYGNGEFGFVDDDTLIESFRPTNAYGFSKSYFDIWVKHTKLINKAVGLKFFNVYGPNEYHKHGQMSFVPVGLKQAKENSKIRLFKSLRPDFKDGEQKRDFVYVSDCIKVIEWFLEPENKGYGGIYNVGTGNARTWNELANAIFNSISMNSALEYIDLPQSLVNHYQYFTEASLKKLRSIGYSHTFVPLEEGVKDYVQNYLLTDNLYR
jgi:ADP-L-glycero-D-manno-heptose 6-epimerase